MADNQYDEKNKHTKRNVYSVLLGIFCWWLGAILVFPLMYVISGYPLSEVSRFFKGVFDLTQPVFLLRVYVNWFAYLFNSSAPSSLALYLPFLPFIALFSIAIIGILTNPYGQLSTVFGNGRLATYEDIKKMNLFNGFCIVLGRFKGKLMKLNETLSVLALAPPGAGKTAGVVVPTIFESDTMSIIVNDVKPELAEKTSGARAKVGPVFVINWGAQDDPEKGIYYPSWNPLSPNLLPPLGPARDMYIDSMVAVLVEEPKGGQDPHWSKTGRNAMTGFLHFIASKCERARANDYFVNKLQEGSFDAEDAQILATYYADMADQSALLALDALKKGQLSLNNYAPVGTWEGLPEIWHGHEACISMILEWLTDMQMRCAADIKRRTDEGDQMAMMADPMKDVLDAAANEANRYAYARRAVTELNQLATTPDKERGSILSTALAGISIFKNAAVKERTKFSDISYRDLRGMIDPTVNKMRPVSVYLSINQVDAKALNSITGIFVELLSSFLIANPPNFKGSDGQKTGPYPVLFVLDEFPQMPKLDCVKNGPAVGRGQKVAYLLIGQDFGQISAQYGKDDMETIISTTAAKIILSQNNDQTAERFVKMIGSKTIEVKSTSKQENGFDLKGMFSDKPSSGGGGTNVSRQLQKTDVVSAADILSLDPTKQYVLVQSNLSHPILADAPRYYLDKKFLKQAALPPAPFVPSWIVARRPVEENQQMLTEGAMTPQLEYAQNSSGLAAPESAMLDHDMALNEEQEAVPTFAPPTQAPVFDPPSLSVKESDDPSE